MFDFERATDYIRSLELPGALSMKKFKKMRWQSGTDYSAEIAIFAIFN